MKILVNGEERNLSIIDRNSGCDWILIHVRVTSSEKKKAENLRGL